MVRRTSIYDDPRRIKKDSYLGYMFREDLSPWMRCTVPIVGDIRFNPFVTFSSILLIWSFVGASIYNPDKLPFLVWKDWIVQHFTWLYIGSQDIWAIFAIVLYFSKYSRITLGKPGETPEYNDVTWFMMLFACGVGTGLFFYGVAEPVYHYTIANRYNVDPTLPDNTLAQIAMNVTLYHWGIHAWIVYCIVGLLLGVLCYREDLPMTMKSCFYPLIGDRIFGWLGDLIDTVSICTTLFGVCTSLGLGARQLNAGLHIVFPDNFPKDDLHTQVILIWIITAIATASTLSGVGMGIRRLSEICVIMGMFIMFVVLFLDDPFYTFNLTTQSIGYYLQYIVQLGWHCDAFEMLGPSWGWEERNRFVPEGFEPPDGPPNWMNDWTMFYWGWWISWSPFVGIFIARISRGRTIREFINGTLTAPVVYAMFWMVLFGGLGLKQERFAAGAGLCCVDKRGWLLDPPAVSAAIESLSLNGAMSINDSVALCERSRCGDCAAKTISRYVREGKTYGEFVGDYADLGEDFGSALPDRSLSRLSCHDIEEMWFDLMRSYGELGDFLSVFSMLGIVLYFVTSSDSGSLVVDCLSANGDPDPPKVQRVFWAVTEGATATALIVASGEKGLSALQAAGLTSGLPYTFIICLLCTAIWRAVMVAAGDLDPFGPDFAVGLFDPMFAEPYGRLSREKTGAQFAMLLRNVVAAPFTVAAVAATTFDGERRRWWRYAVPSVLPFALWVLFHALEVAVSGCWAVGWFFYIGYAIFAMTVRKSVREGRGIVGNIYEDFFACLLFYPNAAVQMQLTVDAPVQRRAVEEEQPEFAATPEEQAEAAKDVNGDVEAAKEADP